MPLLTQGWQVINLDANDSLSIVATDGAARISIASGALAGHTEVIPRGSWTRSYTGHAVLNVQHIAGVIDWNPTYRAELGASNGANVSLPVNPSSAVLWSNASGTGFVPPDGGPARTAIISRSCGIPFVMPANGNITTTSGGVTVGTAFNYVIGPSYAYFPNNALFSGSAAGWYYTNWSSATAGTVFADAYTSGVAVIPVNPTPLATTVAAYTQATGSDITGPNYVVPGGFLGPNGYIEWGRFVNNNNSAGTKSYGIFIGSSFTQFTSQTTNPLQAGWGTIRNRGSETQQIGANGQHGDNDNVSTQPKPTIDTRVNFVVSMSSRLVTATDYAIIEAHHFKFVRGD